MKKFIIKGSLFFMILLVLFFVISGFKKPEDEYYGFLAAIIDKHRQIDEIQSPKIILAGGSNMAFGIDSKELEKASNMPVVNLGLHAGLGLSFILNELKCSLKENDIVFLSFEYYLPNEGKYSWKKITSNFFPEASKYYSRNYLMDLDYYMEGNQKTFKHFFSNETNNSQRDPIQGKADLVYTRSAFNKNGDVISHLDKPNRKTLRGRQTYTYKYWKGIDEINQFTDYAATKQACVFFLYPPFPVSEFNKNKNVISLLDLDLRKNLQAEILNTPDDLVFSDSCFFDTVYHLGKFARKKRTDKMVELINRNAIVQQCIDKSRGAKSSNKL